jgi:hypothetical protein
MNRAVKLLVTGGVAAVGLVGVGASPALAGNGDLVKGGTGPGGPYAQVRVVYRGDVNRSAGSGGSISVPATCWWEPIAADVLLGNPPVDASNPESVADYFEWSEQANAGTSFSGANLALPPPEDIADAVNRAKNGEKITWYRAECREGVDPVKEGFIKSGGLWDGVVIGEPFRAFADAEGPPEPLVAAETLAAEALRVLQIDTPDIDRNPQIATDAGAATLVNWQTYFWLTNQTEALGSNDALTTRTATAEVVDGAPSATVTATLDDLAVIGAGIAPGNRTGVEATGRVSCTPQQAVRKYGDGATGANTCNVKFTRASVGRPGGFPVQMTTTWTGDWAGIEADGDAVQGAPGDITIEPRTSTVNVPVAESQAVVDAGR